MFYKITNENENHNGFQYVDGLNILDKPFQESGSCVPGGLYYTDEDNLYNFYQYGVWIRVVSIPDDAKVVEDPIKVGGRKWRTDKIILHDKYPLYDLGTIKKFNLKITKEYIKEVSKLGKVDILEWWINSYSFENNLLLQIKSMMYASGYGKINVLDFWKNSGYHLQYSDSMIDYASMYNQIEVLDWWKNSGLPIVYSEDAIDNASSQGHINVLDWWKNSSLKLELEFKLKYSKYALHRASSQGHINVLDWWLKSNLPLKYDEYVLLGASQNGHINVLEWWLKSNLPLKYNTNILNYLEDTCDDDVIDWWHANILNKKTIKNL